MRSRILIFTAWFASYLVGGLTIFLIGCQVKPTKVYQSVPTQAKESGGPLVITPQTVVLDARPAFDYALAHINGSFNMQWDDFSQRQEPFRGLLEVELYSHTRRLARLGIGPDTPVVVVGRGSLGGGEEGRLAWTLRYLGVRNVRFSQISYFSLPMSQAEAPPRESQPSWKPELDQTLIVEMADFLKGVAIPKISNDAPIILDVRSLDEYLRRGTTAFSRQYGTQEPDVGAIHIPWFEFFDEKGIAKKEVLSQLQEIGVTTNREILVICTQGVRSAAVTLALRDLGFAKTKNFAGGFRQLVLDRSSSSKTNQSRKTNSSHKTKK